MKNKINNSLENKVSKIYYTKPSITEFEIRYATIGWGEQFIMSAFCKQEI
jgi:hypothetical protein